MLDLEKVRTDQFSVTIESLQGILSGQKIITHTMKTLDYGNWGVCKVVLWCAGSSPTSGSGINLLHNYIIWPAAKSMIQYIFWIW